MPKHIHMNSIASGNFANLTIRGISISNLDKVYQDEAGFIAERRVEVLIISQPLSRFFFTLPTLESKFLPTTPGRKRGPSISRSIFASCIWDTPPKPKDAVVTSAKTRKSCLLIVSSIQTRKSQWNCEMLLFVCLFLWLHRCTHSQCSSRDQDIHSKGFRFIFTFYCRGGIRRYLSSTQFSKLVALVLLSSSVLQT